MPEAFDPQRAVCALMLCEGLRQARKVAKKQRRKDRSFRNKVVRKYARDLNPLIADYLAT